MPDWRLVTSDSSGEISEHRTLFAQGMTFGGPRPLGEMIPLPRGATLCFLPGRVAAGLSRRGAPVAAEGAARFAVGALLPTGYGRLQLPAFVREDGAPTLPLFGYTAVAARAGRLYVAATPIDDAATWRPSLFGTPDLKDRVDTMLSAAPHSRLLRQLALCALDYGCYTAQNMFYRRWEGAIPSSPQCSAQCVGCISEQLGQEVTSPQDRLPFSPTPEEIAEVAVPHLREAEQAMISFGQGCEGDPLNRWRPLAQSIRLMRQATTRGTINMNTNGWHTRGLDHMCEAGLGRIRVSLFSATHDGYNAYYRPRGYTLDSVERSMRLAHDRGLYVAINLLTFPGYTDALGEVDALCGLLERTAADEVQVRTLNIDPAMLRSAVPLPTGDELGIKEFVATLRRRLPGLHVATHSRPAPQRAAAPSGELTTPRVAVAAHAEGRSG